MARKVFISFLGTNNYLQTYYEFEGEKSSPVRFVQEALTDRLCNDWAADDKILIFYTKDSKRLNWEDNGQVRAESEIEKIGLKSIFSQKSFSNIVEGVMIEEGFTKNEIWSIFDVVYDKLEEDDEIYFDVTHAFRSIPMFSTVLFNFAHLMKGTSLKSVHYGAFEKLGPAYEVKKMPLEDRVAPIIDLTSLIELQNLTQIASGFVEYGKIGKIGSMLNVSSFPSQMSQTVSKLKIAIDKLEGYILTNRISDIIEAKFIEEINISFSKLLKSEEIKAAEIAVLKKLVSKLSEFKKDSEENVLAAIRWAFEYDMIVQAYTMAQEYLITCVYKIYKEDNFYEEPKAKDREKKYRMFIGSVLGISDKDVINDNLSGKLQDNEVLAKRMLDEDFIKRIRPHYKKIADNRNTLNHAKKSDLTIEQFKSQFEISFKECLNQFESC